MFTIRSRWSSLFAGSLLVLTLPSLLLGQTGSPLEGFTSPYRDIHVGSPLTSTITQLRVAEGDAVRRGEILVQLDDAVMQAAVDVARQTAASRGELEAAEEALRTKQRRLDQTLGLRERDHATPQEYETALGERDEAAARVRAHEELIARREQELRKIEIELARLTVRAPLDGIVVELFRDVGEVVSPANPPLVRIVQLDPLKVIASGPSAQVDGLRAGQTLPVQVGSLRAEGTVEYVAPIVDAQSGRRVVHLRLPNPQGRIASGMPCLIGSPSNAPDREASPRLQQSSRSGPLSRRTH